MQLIQKYAFFLPKPVAVPGYWIDLADVPLIELHLAIIPIECINESKFTFPILFFRNIILFFRFGHFFMV